MKKFIFILFIIIIVLIIFLIIKIKTKDKFINLLGPLDWTFSSKGNIYNLIINSKGIVTFNGKMVTKQNCTLTNNVYNLSFYTEPEPNVKPFCYFDITQKEHSIIFANIKGFYLDIKNPIFPNNMEPIPNNKLNDLHICSTILMNSQSTPGKLKAISHNNLVWGGRNPGDNNLFNLPNYPTADNPYPLKIKFMIPPGYEPYGDIDNPPFGMKNGTFFGLRKTYNTSITEDENGNFIIWDPLEYVYYQSDCVRMDAKINIFCDIRECIKDIFYKRFAPIVSIPVVFVKHTYTGKTHIRISFDQNDGCWSSIGTECLNIPQHEPTMNFASFDVGTVMHEFGHAFGLLHEHQSPIDNPLNFNDGIYDYFYKKDGWLPEEVNTDVLNIYTKDEITGSKFDPYSIMLYFFPNRITFDNKGTSQIQRLSPKDILRLNELYSFENRVNLDELSIFYNEIYKIPFNFRDLIVF